VALAASLALNLLLVGAGLGLVSHVRDGGTREARFVRLMPESQRDAARGILDRLGEEREGGAAAMRGVHREILAALRADPFEPDRLARAIEARNTLRADRRRRFQTVILELAPEMTLAERRELADRLERAIRRWTERRGG
jgi:uncharacterized membrane protein